MSLAGRYSPMMVRGEPTKTIAYARAGGETALIVHCLGVGGYHQATKTFEELKLWNDMIFVDVRSIGISSAFNAAVGT
jgi:hypothetical protein